MSHLLLVQYLLSLKYMLKKYINSCISYDAQLQVTENIRLKRLKESDIYMQCNKNFRARAGRLLLLLLSRFSRV